VPSFPPSLGRLIGCLKRDVQRRAEKNTGVRAIPTPKQCQKNVGTRAMLAPEEYWHQTHADTSTFLFLPLMHLSSHTTFTLLPFLSCPSLLLYHASSPHSIFPPFTFLQVSTWPEWRHPLLCPSPTSKTYNTLMANHSAILYKNYNTAKVNPNRLLALSASTRPTTT
jgi:hypothetical protein